jgi:maltooligosyltrehalose trehalohydrolase
MPVRMAQLFGPLREDGVTHFRLFAPSMKTVALEVAGRAPIAMWRRDDGFHEAVADAAPGSRYRFVVQGRAVPDPASRGQSGGVHGWSIVPGSESYVWKQGSWLGRPWVESVIYELHVGLAGGFSATEAMLEPLADTGFSAIELMPIAAFPGTRNWGYDGVLPFAPAEAYGSADQLKSLIDRAHALDLMVYLDVVYNHFGPDGNYLSRYVPEFFRKDTQTPWGAAIDFRRPEVRRFFIENALSWINDFRFDGLRLDAVHAIAPNDWLAELASEVRAGIRPDRHVHLVLENDNNDTDLLRQGFDAQWNDDFHHVLHVLLTGESQGYYKDHTDHPSERLARVLKDGFDYQGQHSTHRSRARGLPSGDLAPTSFVSFLQNHDQIGNRAFGERLTTLADNGTLRAAIALLLLAPQIPLVFMGEEIGSESPFFYFTDHDPTLADAVRKGRAREFGFDSLARIPDPNAIETFKASQPSKSALQSGEWRKLFRDLLRIRREQIVVRLRNARAISAEAVSPAAVLARWRLADGAGLTIASNLGSSDACAELPTSSPIWGEATDRRIPARATIAWLDRA